MYINQQDAQISVTKLYFLIRCSTCFLRIATQQPGISEYIKCDAQLIKVVSDDGLT